jgi:hypothetical protein
VQTRILYLPKCFSAAFAPVVEPMVVDGGAIICNLYDVAGLWGFGERLLQKYKTPRVSPRACVETFFTDIYEQFAQGYWMSKERSHGFIPYAVVTKNSGQLTLHYYYNPQAPKVMPEKRRELYDQDQAFKVFRDTHNKENSEIKDIVFLTHKAEGMGDSTESACKVADLLVYLQRNGVAIHPYDDYEAFKAGVLGLLADE